MTEGWKSIELDAFEHVVTGPSQSLLRVSGKAAPGSEATPKPTLVIGVPPAQQQFAPLRAPQDRGGVLRAAYAVPTALVQSGAPCWLELDDGSQTELPVPAEGTARMRDGGVASAALHEPVPAPELDATEAELARAQEELARARDELGALDQQIAELERARDDDHRAAATSAVQAQSRLELAEQRAEAAERELGAVQDRAHAAEQRAQTFEDRVETAEVQRQAALAQAEAAKDEAASAAASVAPLERRAAELEQAALTGEARIQTLERDLAAVAPAREALQREVDKLRGRQSTLERELDKSRDQLRIMTFERDELSRQAAAFDGVAVKARERAAQAEAANEKATAALHELQIWRGELERRLAETTSELGAARAARETDERELMRLRATVDEYDRDRRSGEAARSHGEA